MTVEEKKKLKEDVLRFLPDMVDYYKKDMVAVDERLYIYCKDVSTNEGDTHNLYEILSVTKFCRLLDTYEWRVEEAKKFINMYEALKFNGMNGRQTYKLTPIQVFQFSSIFGFYREDGTRLCRQFILFLPRKFGKTTAVASLAVYDMLFGDSNGQAYMASNAENQSSICFREAKQLLQQLDPDGKRFRITASEMNWKTPNALGKESMCAKLTAGGRTKDGLNASLVIYDEYAAARYVKDHSDGAELLNVLTSSMGTRKQPLTGIITTANRVIDGPFESMLNDAKEALIENDSDWQFASIFCPDEWELDDESLSDPRVWKKCNPHIGITIQPNFYKEEFEQAKRDNEKMKEFRCKYLNVFQSDTVRDWITASDIRKLQIDQRIDDLDAEDGWVCIAAQDFSKGDDLNAQAYLCFDGEHYFFDCDAWISEDTLHNNPNHRLYQKWVDDGWLRVSPGRTIDEMLVVDRIAEINENAVPIVRIGYDPYDSSRFVTAEKELIFSNGGNPDEMLKIVRQTWGNYNASVQVMDYLVKTDPAICHFSMNPLLPWCFGNCVLEEDRMENVKPVKRSQNQKVDVAQCCCSCVILLAEMQQKLN